MWHVWGEELWWGNLRETGHLKDLEVDAIDVKQID
jgi:hypothetical protein